MMPETIEMAKKAAAVSDEVLPLLDPFSRTFYLVCKDIAEGERQKPLAQERHTQKPVYIE